MSAIPKLPATKRAEVQQVVQRRRILTKLIATLQDEKRQIPDNKTLCQRLGVSYNVLRRTLYGDPYRTAHPDDEHGTAA